MLHRKICKTPGCKNLHYNKSGYCDKCHEKYVRDKSNRFVADEERQKVHSLGYNQSTWKEFARNYIRLHPVCAICGAPATVCDHKTMTARQMIDAYGKFELDESLYQPLCRACNIHKQKQDRQSDREYFKQKEDLEQFSTSDIGIV